MKRLGRRAASSLGMIAGGLLVLVGVVILLFGWISGTWPAFAFLAPPLLFGIPSWVTGILVALVGALVAWLV